MSICEGQGTLFDVEPVGHVEVERMTFEWFPEASVYRDRVRCSCGATPAAVDGWARHVAGLKVGQRLADAGA